VAGDESFDFRMHPDVPGYGFEQVTPSMIRLRAVYSERTHPLGETLADLLELGAPALWSLC
jgi:hypothetical protein